MVPKEPHPRYIGRYTKDAVLAEYRITHYDGKVVRFAFKDYAKGGKTSFKTLRVLAFIGRPLASRQPQTIRCGSRNLDDLMLAQDVGTPERPRRRP